jgi:signal transduction histidine kinase
MRTEQDAKTAANGGAKSVAPPHPYLLPIAVTVVTVGVFAAAIFLMMTQLREQLRAKVMEQDSLVLQAAALMQAEGGSESHDDQLVNMVMASSANKDIFGVRLFDKEGHFVNAFPKGLLSTQLSPRVLEVISAGSPFSRFEPALDVKSEFKDGTVVGDSKPAPVMFATVPIKSEKGEMVAAAEFLVDGSHIVGQLREIDHAVRHSAVRFCLVGGSVIFLVLSWAFSRLNKANQLLAERTANLLRANHELTMAAKTSAVGAVAAHLIHGLKNPLFGLQAFVAVKSENEGAGEWKAAIDSTKRMQQMISDVVRIMREESGDSGYEVSIEELLGILESKLCLQAKEASVKLRLNARGDGALPNREANLIILVLTNLIQNAIQASKPTQTISLEMSEREGAVCFDLSDQAGGLPPAMMANLFTPCQSSKAGGTGLGLAISKQLANHLGGRLELVKTDKEGTTFRLAIPRELFVGVNSKPKSKLEPANALA